MKTNLTFTENALKKATHLLSESKTEENNCLRIYIVGGGCSGFQYGFIVDKHYSVDEDRIFEFEHVNSILTIAIDNLSYQYLEGAEIDYTENLLRSGFSVKNPHAETTCGCGSSFSLKEDS